MYNIILGLEQYPAVPDKAGSAGLIRPDIRQDIAGLAGNYPASGKKNQIRLNPTTTASQGDVSSFQV